MARKAKRTRRKRRRELAETRAAARRARQRRQTLGYVLGGVALAAAVVLAVVATKGDGSGDGATAVEPARPGEVTVEGPARTEPLAAGEAVPGFSAPGIGGGTVSWDEYGGAPAVLSVWAPWCPHCQKELPVLDRVMREFPWIGFVTVVTSIGDRPGPDAGAFLEDNGIVAPTAIDDEAGSIAGALGVRGFPTTYFVASDGTVVRVAEGEVEADVLRQVIGRLS